MLILMNKPYGVLSRFTGPEGQPNLSDFVDERTVYPAGRLDRDSEGLLLLTDDGTLQSRITGPRYRLWKTYWVQVEGIPTAEAMRNLREGVVLKDGRTRPARIDPMDEPVELWPRVPPIRERRSIPTSWIRLSIREGRNRQVRRMTAAVGYPTLRLIRYAVGGATLQGLLPGMWRYEAGDIVLAGSGTRNDDRKRRREP